MTSTLTFQLLPCSIAVSFEDPSLEGPLSFLRNSAEQPVRPIRTFRYSILGTGPYELREDGDLLASVGGVEGVLSVLSERFHRRVYHLLALGGWTLVHAALVNVAGQRLMVVASTGTGKSTLSLHLLLQGHAVEGDEMVLVRDGNVIAFPRRFRIKPGTLAVLPELQRIAPILPGIDQDGTRVAGLDPREAGYAWSLRSGPITALIVAVPNHGGDSFTREVDSADALHRLLPQVYRIDDSPASRSRLVRTCSQLTSAGVYELQLGDLRQAVDALATIPVPARTASTTF